MKKLIIAAATAVTATSIGNPARAQDTLLQMRKDAVEPIDRKMVIDIATYKSCLLEHALALGRASHEDANTIITAAAGMCGMDELVAVSDMENIDRIMGEHKSEAEEQVYVQGWRNSVLPQYLMARAGAQKAPPKSKNRRQPRQSR
jgi:hypothetical protein